jgi:hypothetical protein
MIRLNNNVVAIFRYLQLLTPLYTTNSIYIANIWEEPMPRCLYVKLQPQIDYVVAAVKKRLDMKLISGRKDGLAGIEH